MPAYCDRLPFPFHWRAPQDDRHDVPVELILEFKGRPVGFVRAMGAGWMASFGTMALGFVPSSIIVPSLDRGQGWLARAARSRLVALERATRLPEEVMSEVDQEPTSCT